MATSFLVSVMKKWFAFVFISFFVSNIFACDKSNASLVSQTNNGNGTFTFVVNVCREYSGLEGNPSDLTFTFNCGVTILPGFSPASYVTSTNDVYTGTRSGSVLTYHTSSVFIAHCCATLCGNFTITTSGYPTSLVVNTHPDYTSAQCVKTFAISLLSPPTADATPSSVCQNGSSLLSASSCLGGNLKWYDAPTNGTLLQTGATYNTPTLASTTSFYVDCSVSTGGCVTARTQVDVEVLPCILPLALLDFQSTCINNKVQLFWETSNNIENADFLIEESENGTDFIPKVWLKQVNYQHTGNQYMYVDGQKTTKTNYYRIVLIDENGNRNESAPLKVANDCGSKGVSLNSAYYAENGINLLLLAEKQEEILWSISDISGKILYSEKKEIMSGFNTIHLNMTLSASIYIVKVSSATKTQSQKIMVSF